jgi:hypothetical protein
MLVVAGDTLPCSCTGWRCHLCCLTEQPGPCSHLEQVWAVGLLPPGALLPPQHLVEAVAAAALIPVLLLLLALWWRLPAAGLLCLQGVKARVST